MRIAFIVASQMYPDNIGGAEIFTFRIASELSKRGYEVYIVAFEGEKFKRKKIGNLILYGTASKKLAKIIKEKSKLLTRIMMTYHLMKIKPDICIAVMLHSVIPAYIYSKIFRKKLIIRYSGGDVHLLLTGEKRLVRYVKEYLVAKIFFTLIKDKVIQIALSRDMKRDLLKLGAKSDKIILIPNPIDKEFFKIEPNYEGNVIGFLGRLIERKGIRTLIEAFKMLTEKFEDLKLILIGDGPLRKSIVKEIKNTKLESKITITGYKPYSEIPKMLEKLSIFVLPSHYGEGLSNALLQAMAAKLPIITTKIRGATDLITHGYNGILISPREPGKLSEAIEKLLKDKSLARKLGRNAYKTAQKYSMEKIVKEYEKIIKQQFINA
ncbi:MAG: glycosyltransferase family 4 protein [archaeon GB-1867-035]|nr:glycosyltransferase family 4 protein [Candidatus Culexmicrobium profundum]